ncbi:putative integral membrane protein [Saprospira grandis DSM 2844]|uniref:Putative integral membrane protein n=2 Tax=Saprospira TaxID=1007 RepID=J0XZE7_9BACT|nr:putative integral membrane protein [Saprospira grandis DSM 2844]
MDLLFLLAQLLLFFALPYLLAQLNAFLGLQKYLSNIIICYALGMLLGNAQPLLLSESLGAQTAETAKLIAFVSVLLALPLLLMTSDLRSWLRYLGHLGKVFFIMLGSTLILALAFAYALANGPYEELPTILGMFTGVYIGGTPNMVAVSQALEAEDGLFVLLNATDVLCSGLYFLLLLSLGNSLLGRLLPKFKPKGALEEEEAPAISVEQYNVKQIIWALGLAILILGLSALPALYWPNTQGEINSSILLLSITTASILLSVFGPSKHWQGVYPFADYLLLVFGLGAGYLANFSELAQDGGSYLLLNASFLGLLLLLQLFWAYIFRIDRDSFMICSTATVMGPPFVAQISSSLKNRSLLAPAIAFSLLGLALANYLGVLVAYLAELF